MSERVLRRLLVAGAAGFIGSNFVKLLRRTRPEVEITVLDKLTYAGNPANLAELEGTPGYHFVRGDITDGELVDDLAGRVDAIVNFAAETHVDRSLLDPFAFVLTDVLGTGVLAEAARGAQDLGEHGVIRRPLVPSGAGTIDRRLSAIIETEGPELLRRLWLGCVSQRSNVASDGRVEVPRPASGASPMVGETLLDPGTRQSESQVVEDLDVGGCVGGSPGWPDYLTQCLALLFGQGEPAAEELISAHCRNTSSLAGRAGAGDGVCAQPRDRERCSN